MPRPSTSQFVHDCFGELVFEWLALIATIIACWLLVDAVARHVLAEIFWI